MTPLNPLDVPRKMPPKVDRYEHWVSAPPKPSERLLCWIERFIEGWRPNRRISSMGYDSSAEWYGVFMWEYLCIIWPLSDASVDRNDSYSYPDEWAELLEDSKRRLAAASPTPTPRAEEGGEPE